MTSKRVLTGHVQTCAREYDSRRASGMDYTRNRTMESISKRKYLKEGCNKSRMRRAKA